MTDSCDLFENGGEGDCGGPTFSDPQPEGIDLKVCAFHTLMNRNHWMTRAINAESAVRYCEGHHNAADLNKAEQP